jgi:hypothetical protein
MNSKNLSEKGDSENHEQPRSANKPTSIISSKASSKNFIEKNQNKIAEIQQVKR